MFTHRKTSQPQHDCFSWSGARRTLVSIFYVWTPLCNRRGVHTNCGWWGPLKIKMCNLQNTEQKECSKTGEVRCHCLPPSSLLSPPFLNSFTHTQPSAHLCLCILKCKRWKDLKKMKTNNKDTNFGSASRLGKCQILHRLSGYLRP